MFIVVPTRYEDQLAAQRQSQDEILRRQEESAKRQEELRRCESPSDSNRSDSFYKCPGCPPPICVVFCYKISEELILIPNFEGRGRILLLLVFCFIIIGNIHRVCVAKAIFFWGTVKHPICQTSEQPKSAANIRKTALLDQTAKIF